MQLEKSKAKGLTIPDGQYFNDQNYYFQSIKATFSKNNGYIKGIKLDYQGSN